MSSPPRDNTPLHLDWCSYQAARFACRHWHYSGSVPGGKRAHIGVWEQGRFIGCVIFSGSSNQNLGTAFGLSQFETTELSRVALTQHQTPVTRILAIARRMLQQQFPGLRLIVSYADTDQGHHGGIYAGGNWIYTGLVEVGRKGKPSFIIRGRLMHPRTVHQRGWKQQLAWLRAHVDPRAEAVYPGGKHKYLYALDQRMRDQLRPLHQPYPKQQQK